MAKEFVLEYSTITGLGATSVWYKGTTIELLSNTGKTPIRVDKLLSQISGYHSGVNPVIFGAVIHLSDETGATFDDAITSGTTTTAGLETILNQWKELIWLTDFEVLGTGSDEVNIHVSELSADTRRLLNPGQSLNFTLLAQPTTTETSKYISMMLDAIMWYSAGA